MSGNHKIVYLDPKGPYMGTTVPVNRSLDAIRAMLKKHDCEKIYLGEDQTRIQGMKQNPVTLYTLGFMKAGVSYVIKFPVIVERGPVIGERFRNDVSARIIHDRVKALLIHVDLGLQDFSQAMMNYTAIQSGGNVMALEDVVLENLDKIKGGTNFLSLLP